VDPNANLAEQLRIAALILNGNEADGDDAERLCAAVASGDGLPSCDATG